MQGVLGLPFVNEWLREHAQHKRPQGLAARALCDGKVSAEMTLPAVGARGTPTIM